MSRMKTFRTYLILFILFYIFVSFMSYGFIKSTYSNMDTYQINVESPKIVIQEAKSSKVSGYIKGIIQNNTNEKLGNEYLKFELVSQTGNIITSKYVDISGIEPGEQKEFSVKFNAENIVTFNTSISDTDEITQTDPQFKVKLMEVVSAGLIVLTAIKVLRFFI